MPPLEREAVSETTPDAGFPSPVPSAGSPGAIGFIVLHEVLLALAHGVDRQEALALLASRARLLTSCASAAVALSSDDGDFVTFAAVSGEGARDLQGTQVRAADTIAGNTATTGEPLLLFHPDEGTASRGGGSAVSSAAVVPIHLHGKPVGALAALNKLGSQPFDGNDLLALNTLAAAAATALANHRLRDDSLRHARELSILYEGVRYVSGELSAQEVLNALIDQVATHIPTTVVVVFLLNDERTHFYIAADQGLPDALREVTLPTDSPPGAKLMAANRPLFLAFTETDDGPSPGQWVVGPEEAPLPEVSARSGIAAPLRSGDSIHGVILALSNQYSPYTEADSNLLEALASQAAVAIENAWLYEDATRRAEEAAALYDLSQTITSTLRLPDVLELVADSVLKLLAVDKFALFLHDRRSDRLQLVVARGLPEGVADRVQPLVGEGIPGWVMEFETPSAVQDVAADHRNASAPLHTEGVVSMTCMPLQVGASTIGVLCALSSRRRLFTVAEMELLYTIANQAAIAIENARNYADVRQKSRELRRYFHRVARALGSAENPEDVPNLIATLTVEVMGADRGVLYSVSEDGSRLQVEASVNFRPDPNAGDAIAAGSEEIPAGWIARRVRSLAIEDISQDPRFSQSLPRTIRGRLGSYLGVPLRSERKAVGVLEVYTRGPRKWSNDEIRLLLTFATQATVALKNARLAEESGRSRRHERLLQSVLEVVAAGDAAPQPVAEAIAASLGGGAVALEHGGGGWTISGRAGVDPGEAEKLLPRMIRVLEASPDSPDDDLVVVRPAVASSAIALISPQHAGDAVTQSVVETIVRILASRSAR